MNYYDYTGDAELVRELAPEVYGLLDTFTSWRGKYGLISEAPNYMFMDWVTIAGFEVPSPARRNQAGLYGPCVLLPRTAGWYSVAKLMGDTARAGNFTKLPNGGCRSV